MLLECSTNLTIHRELLSQNVIGLLRHTFFSQSILERSNDELLCYVSNIITNLLMNPDPDIVHEIKERVRADGLHFHLLQLILSSTNPFVLIDAGRTLLVFGLEFINMLANQDENFRILLIRALDKYKSHPKKDIQDVWYELSKCMPQ
jgi:hypothetical protein